MRRWWPIGILLAGLIAFFAFDLDRFVSFQALADHREALMHLVDELGPAAPLVFILVYALVTALSIPGGAVLTVTAGFLFGTLAGGAYSVIGATLGAIAVFLAARTALGRALQAHAGAAVRRFEAGFRENALSYLLVLRLVPIFPFWLVNLVPALLGVPLATFVLGTFLGIIPGGLVYASVGSGLGAVLERGQTPDLGIVFDPVVLVPLLALSALALVPVVYRRFGPARLGRS